MADKHKVLLEWPHSEPTEVIVAGSFNDWARTCHLTKGPTGFTGLIHVPWGSRITYKYIVDGTWTTHPDQPTEPDHDGNINNMYIAPPQPQSKPNDNGKPEPTEVPDTTTGSLPQLVAHLADTGVVREGTSSAPDYVASGVGAAPNSVAGIDPINAEQVPISTPLQTAKTEFDVPDSTVSDGALLASVPAEVSSSLQHPVSENPATSGDPKVVTAPEPPGQVASDILVPIVPVNAAENNAVPTPAVEPVVTPAEDVRDAGMEKKELQQEQSTHTAVKVNEEVPAIVQDITNKAEEIPMTIEEPHAVTEETLATKSVPAQKQDTAQAVNTPVAAANGPSSPVASVDHASTPEEHSSEASRPLKVPEATTASDLNPSSVLVSEIRTGAAPSATSRETAMPLQEELDKLEQIKSEPVADALKVEPAPVSAPELSLEMSDVAPQPAVAETVLEPVAEPEAKREKEESAPVQSVLSAGTVLVSQTPQKAVENGNEPSVEPLSVKQEEKVSVSETEVEVETKQVEPTPAVTQDPVPVSGSKSAPVPTSGAAAAEPTSASMVEAAPAERVAAPAIEVAPAEPTPAKPLSAPTLKAAPTEPTSQATSAELAPTSAIEVVPAEPAPKTEVAPEPTKVAPAEPAPVPNSVSAPAPFASEPVVAAVVSPNGHAQEAADPAPASTASANEVFPSTASPTASPSKSVKSAPARKKRSSIFGRIKHFFESDKSKN